MKMPHTKQITIGIVTNPPNRSKSDIFGENLTKLKPSYREILFRRNFNINLFENG